MAAEKRKSSRHTEIERKFAVPEGAVSPSFEGLASVTRVDRSPAQYLDARYFDTPDHALAAHHITLRRRTGGPDAGWHLKLPAGTDARTEVHVPLIESDGSDANSVPDELRDIVLAIVRHQSLVPVARIATARTVDVLYGPSGQPVAEFCDDAVTASAGTAGEEKVWREWELELSEASDGAEGVDVAPDRELLDRLTNRLFDAGAEPAGHGSKLAHVLETTEPVPAPTDPVHRAIAEQVEEMLVWDRAVRADAWDSVHQMRVVTRKIRSLLRESDDSFGISDDDAWVFDELRLLAGVLGVARDAEVLAEKYQTALAGLPDELIRGPVRERLVVGALARYRIGWRRSLVAMRSDRYFRLLDALEALVAARPEPAAAGEEPAPVSIASAHRRIRKAAKRADSAQEEDRDEALHRIRKGAKRLRYTAAATGAAEVADRAKAVQTLLGDHQDAVVSRTHLALQSEAAHAAGEDTFTYGLLYQLEDDIARHSRDQLRDALKKLNRSVRKED